MAADVVSTRRRRRAERRRDPGKLMNGTFALASPLQVSATSPLGTAGALGTTLL